MSVGFPQDKNAVDSRAGSVVLSVRLALDEIHAFKAYVDSVADAYFTSLGYSVADISALRGGITDLDNLYKIAHAQGTQASANDFFFNAKALTGVQ